MSSTQHLNNKHYLYSSCFVGGECKNEVYFTTYSPDAEASLKYQGETQIISLMNREWIWTQNSSKQYEQTNTVVCKKRFDMTKWNINQEKKI